MPLQATYQKYLLRFKFEAGTSRGSYTQKNTYFLKIWDTTHPTLQGIGEAAPLAKLSPDDRPDFENFLQHLCQQLNGLELQPDVEFLLNLAENFVPDDFPSVRFALETALLDWLNQGKRIIFPSDFTKGKHAIRINGLIWMGKKDFMLTQIEEKIKQNFTCLKLKIGALDFEQELEILSHIRQHFDSQTISIRLDANGAFQPNEALAKLERLAQFDIHSIEQPIAPEQEESMRFLCQNSPIPIALDEELIGKTETMLRNELLQYLKPAYIILKPTLLGGIQATKEWIQLAENQGIGFWLTSALEANIGLNAIAQLTATVPHQLPQGLGTGQLYHNNIPSPLTLKSEFLYYDTSQPWGEI
ncbi:MAG: o-succinylbenzoate synthase [Microscillaceae bacterium]|nr:o-succinylbenzoate synthase [Microscillaceae bacterium]MDW8459695.1 o-succinylbenzoate synthase [Cytophagales bacterium]